MLLYVCTGFAVNLDLILRKGTNFTAQIGRLETNFLEALVKVKDLEPKADCTKVTNNCG